LLQLIETNRENAEENKKNPADLGRSTPDASQLVEGQT